jgi:hypothetical protein
MSHSSGAEHTYGTSEEDEVVETSIAAIAGCGSPSSQSSPTKANQEITEEKVPNLYEY